MNEKNELYGVAVAKPHYPKIINNDRAYKVLIENWDETSLHKKKEGKTLVLDGDNNVICEVSFDARPKAVLTNLKKSLKIAKDYNAARAIIGLNQTSAGEFPDPKSKILSLDIKNLSEEMNLDVEQLVVSENAYFSFLAG